MTTAGVADPHGICDCNRNRGHLNLGVSHDRTAMANAHTRTGLRTTVAILDGEYPLKEKAPDGYKQSSGSRFDDDLPAWNFRAVPSNWGSESIPVR